MKYQRGPIPANACEVADLSDGDKIATTFDWSNLLTDRVIDANDPAFDAGYRFLHEEFAPRGEMEERSVLAERLLWDPAKPVNQLALLYEMLVVQTQEEVAAVRDHTAIVNLNDSSAPAVVHLSHVLVDKAWRGSGLAAWLRALPIETGRACVRASGKPADHPIVLACEMEHLDDRDPSRIKRLRAYERAGFLKVDPERVNYQQPDFRPPDEIDASAGPVPLPMSLVLRRVGQESQTQITAREVRAIVSSIYGMFSLGFRKQDMEDLWKQLENEYPHGDELIDLVPPTKA